MSDKLGIVGRKIGMTRIFTEDGVSVPVTVLDVSNNRVTMVKTVETDGYNAIQVAFGSKKPTILLRLALKLAACSKSSISKLNRLPNSSPAWPSRPKCSRKVRRST